MTTEFTPIIQKLEQGSTWDFPGGVFPDSNKAPACNKNIEHLPLCDKYYLTIKQHIGVAGDVCVKQGQQVLKGQALTSSSNPYAVPVHAPTSGIIEAITPHVSAHPSAIEKPTVILKSDGEDKWLPLEPIADYSQQDKPTLVEKISQAGISGMGGAGFPTHIKVSTHKTVEFLIINGVECEPYISSDDRLMREHAKEVLSGTQILQHLLSPQKIIIAIEDNKPEALSIMRQACTGRENFMVVSVPTKYPAGGEKQLIQVLTNREVPSKGLPIDVGVIMHNVGTCYAIHDAITHGKPLLERVVTLAGNALDDNKNVWAKIGTPIQFLLDQSQYQSVRQTQQNVIMGGPMMGFNLRSLQTPVIKSTNCLLVPSKKELPADREEQPCIRCSACADACPANLLPQQLFWHSKGKEYDKAQEYNLFDCIECGACAYVCPSDIPLVHYYRQAKSDIRIAQQEKELSDKAKERFEARNKRLLEEQQARDKRHKDAAEARKKAMVSDGGNAKDKIAAALARASAKKQSAQENPPPEDAIVQRGKQDKVAAAVARAKAKKAKLAETESAEEHTSTVQDNAVESSSKNDKIAAAVARAKAKKAKQVEEEQASGSIEKNVESKDTPAVVDSNNKNEKVAAAIAKAKAKRAQQKTAQSKSEDDVASSEKPNTANKQQRIAAAIAKAKAKKAARSDNNQDE